MKKQLLMLMFAGIANFNLFAQLPGIFDPVKELVAAKQSPVFNVVIGSGPNYQAELINGNWRNKDTTNGNIDAQGNITLFYQSKWDTVSNKWDSTGIMITQQFTYDGSNRVTTMKRVISQYGAPFSWSSANYTYDGTGKRMPTTSFDTVLQGANKVALMGVDSFIYNGSGKIADRILIRKVGPAYQPYDRYTYAYDGNGRITQMVYMTFSSSTWKNKTRDTYSYDANGNLIKTLIEGYDQGTSAYVNQELDSFYYNAGAKNTGYRKYNWKSTYWEGDQNQDYVYSGSLISEVYGLDWDTTSKAWFKKEHALVYYDAGNKPTHAYIYHWNGTAYEMAFSKKLIWGTWVSTGLADKNQENVFTVYPNPATNSFSIFADNLMNNLQYKIYDLTGREVLSGKNNSVGANTISVNVNELNKGIYFLLIQNETKTFKQKLIIE